ncbi:MAG: hypothetical protein IPM91_08795 [Bacteroidetes bacterium]|nr:hypothetical protein [Bacteroidota bacterium]
MKIPTVCAGIVSHQYCTSKASTNYKKSEAEKIASVMIQNVVSGQLLLPH